MLVMRDVSQPDICPRVLAPLVHGLLKFSPAVRSEPGAAADLLRA